LLARQGQQSAEKEGQPLGASEGKERPEGKKGLQKFTKIQEVSAEHMQTGNWRTCHPVIHEFVRTLKWLNDDWLFGLCQ
jgi:hypothetical protein